MAASSPAPGEHSSQISITDLLKRLSAPAGANVSAEEIALAFARIFENRLSSTQMAAFLTLLHSTGKDRHPDVIAACAMAMRDAASQINRTELRKVIGKRKSSHGSYRGGLCDIVGTGGDSHSTFNISTTSSIIASPLLMMAKHGNRAQTSKSGSADVLNKITPKAPNIAGVNASNLPGIYEHTNYAFLFAPNFHSGMKHAATVRRELGLRTVFNVMGPLANPVHWALEARLVGVAVQELGQVYAEALKLSGARKALVVCGEENLDEISCAGKTNCWMLRELPNPDFRGKAVSQEDDDWTSDDDAPSPFICELESFQLQPADFGLPAHALSEVSGGKEPEENASILMQILRNELGPDHPILHFVLLNVGALLAISGICEADTCPTGIVIKERGPGGARWKEGVRKARWCIESGQALQQLQQFIEVTNRL